MDIEASHNFRKVNEKLTTSGVVQPDALRSLGSKAYEVVMNLLPDTSEYAVADERQLVESQGIEYIHIPVDFKQPTASDFHEFSKAMDRVRHKRVHVHCAANYRASAFCSLYAVNRGFWRADQAMQFIRGVWHPNEHPAWAEFIADVLANAADREDGMDEAELPPHDIRTRWRIRDDLAHIFAAPSRGLSSHA